MAQDIGLSLPKNPYVLIDEDSSGCAIRDAYTKAQQDMIAAGYRLVPSVEEMIEILYSIFGWDKDYIRSCSALRASLRLYAEILCQRLLEGDKE